MLKKNFEKNDSDRFVFLLCTRAGGLGINLTAADTVIIFDSDWNPQNDLQAQARCHRIGQKKLVKVYRLITSNTYEREMFDKASLKLGLDKAVLQSTTALKAEGTALSKKDVEELLKKGAYGSIMDEENESAKFNEEDIETILQRRTQTITLEAGQKGSLFAKASFNSTHNKGDDIDIDDPEFWTKWAEKAQVDVEKATATPDGRELIIEEPRKRTKRFEDNKMDEEDSDGSDGSGKRSKRGPPGSNRKRRKDDEDTDYSASYRPDELATSKAEYFKVEKVLAQFGWGRWTEIKNFGEFEIAEQDIEHMSRTLLLHCIREFRGDDRIRTFIFNLIKPQGIGSNSAQSVQGQPVSQQTTIYQQGWAALPEFNPPSFALDSAFQRHVHRHANKLMVKIDMLKHLETHIIADEKSLVEDPAVNWTEITLNEMPTISETFIEGWDADCDKCFLIGCWRHGLDNYDTIRADETLCFHEKTIPLWPPPSDFWLRFRRLLMVSQRSVHDPVYEKAKWAKREEQEFLRVIRSYGFKDVQNGVGVDWTTFRTFAPVLEKKTDEELHEQLMCIVAMCNRAQGSNDLKPLDLKRAMSVDPMNSRRALKLLNRIHLMRKVHNLAVNIEDDDLSLCETTGMPSGWSTQHDKELIEICDQCGLDQLAANVLNKPAFSKLNLILPIDSSWPITQNCILADEMGLGKTVQTITFLSQVYDYGVHGPFLIVVPLSTIHNWVREFETWTDMNAVVYHGSAYAREVLQTYEIFYDKRHSGAKNWRKNFVKLDALITTFETVVSDVEFLKKIPWRVCVIDEAHRLKNRNCKLLVNGLLAFRMEHRVLLTGTPLQNNIEELFSLLNFLHPQQFNNSITFLEQFGSCQTDDQVQKLQEILRPMMLRRLKEDVEKSLGPKEETIIEVQLSDMQKKFYRAILERNFSHLCKGTSAPSLMNVMMELRKCCNHPFLINGAEETIMNDFRAAHPTWDEETLAHRALVQASGKVVLIEKLLPKLRKDGHKVLIFSQMVKVLDLLEEFLVSMNYPFERIDGNVRGDLRQAAIDRFSRETISASRWLSEETRKPSLLLLLLFFVSFAVCEHEGGLGGEEGTKN
uniref:Uncharacterized protein n=1 Tax=Caenorhabditis japonica TaxID=281687 RepID=A0A8R1DML0_CAEJA